MRKYYAAAVVFAFVFIAVAAAHGASLESAGDKFMQEKKYRKAIEAYDEALKKQPGDGELTVKLARAYDAAKWYGRSVQYWESYIKAFPKGEYSGEAARQAARAHRWIGVNFYNNGEDAQKVIRQLEKAVELDAAIFEAHYWLGRIHMENGDFESAVKSAEKALNLQPDDAKAKWMLKEARGRLAQGDAAYSYYSKGYSFYKRGDKDSALKEYMLAAEANPKFVDARFWVARIQMEQKQYREAIKSWNEVLKLDPGNKRARWFHDQTDLLDKK